MSDDFGFYYPVIKTAVDKAMLKPPVRSSHVYSMLVADSNLKVISQGFNSYVSHPFQKEYGRTDKAIYSHAETRAIFNALEIDFRGLTIVVARVTKSGVTRAGYPCAGCLKCIKTFGIGTIVFTDGEGQYSYDLERVGEFW